MGSSKINTSRLIKKIGITFVIPIFMLMFGAIMILTVGWNYLASGLQIGKVIFNKPEAVISQVEYKIGDSIINRPGIGEEFGNLTISSIDFESPVLHGDSKLELDQGIGHFPGSTIPGEKGNVIISGHRHTIFRPLEKVKLGDEVIFETTYGKYKYKVSEIKVVDESDAYELRVLDHERLTMYTCYPFTAIGNTSERLIFICDFIESIV